MGGAFRAEYRYLAGLPQNTWLRPPPSLPEALYSGHMHTDGVERARNRLPRPELCLALYLLVFCCRCVATETEVRNLLKPFLPPVRANVRTAGIGQRDSEVPGRL